MINRAHESDKLLRKHPVEVSIFDLLVVFILLVVELSEVVPAEAHADFQALQAVEDRATISAVAIACIAKRSEASLIRSEGLPGNLCRLAKDDDHEGSHQVSSIRLLVELIGSVVE